jgi:squalene/oxidosqualene cyclase-like protein
VYEWDGINSIPAEMWYLPRATPFHPGKLWCHCRMVYLPMCYVYCKRFTPGIILLLFLSFLFFSFLFFSLLVFLSAFSESSYVYLTIICAPLLLDVSKDPLLQSLRSELYNESYDTIKWDAYRQVCAEIDDYSPLNPIMKIAQDFLSYYEYFLPYMPPLKWLRNKALEFVIAYIHEEDRQTNYIDIGPVNKSLNMLAVWIDGGCDNKNINFLKHLPRIDDYLWVAEDGMKMQGYNGSQCWDTSFAVQAIVEGNLISSFPECSRKIYSYLKRTQIAENEEKKVEFFRHESLGGWPFSTAAHGWPISDCTAEGLKGVLALHKKMDVLNIKIEDRISDENLKNACNVILTLHNPDGGWATYENNRGYGWYEMLNPSEVFGDIMIDYSYVECTSACVTALKKFSEVYPTHRAAEILNAIQVWCCIMSMMIVQLYHPSVACSVLIHKSCMTYCSVQHSTTFYHNFTA